MKKYLNKIIFIIILFLVLSFQIEIVNAEDAKNNNPMLKDIKINGKEIEPNFDMFTTEYVLSVDEEVDVVEIEAIPDDENAEVEIIGNTNLEEGKNKFEIKVTAENQREEQSYFVYITKGNINNTNANLKSINIEDCELAPNFDKDVINYAFEYPKDLEKVEIEAIPEDDEAKIEIIGNENLKEVTQNIEVKVTAKDGVTVKTYNLIAKKADLQVEDPRGEEPEKNINENINSNNKENIIFYTTLFVAIILIIVIIFKKKSKEKGEKNEK